MVYGILNGLLLKTGIGTSRGVKGGGLEGLEPPLWREKSKNWDIFWEKIVKFH